MIRADHLTMIYGKNFKAVDDLSLQLRAKMAVSTIFTYPMLVGAELIVGYYVGIKPSVQIYYAVLMLLAHVIAVMTGIGMDSVSPYVAWDDEYSALRGNLNTFFSLAVMMLLTVVVVGVCLVLFEVWKLPLIPFYGVVFLALAVGASVAYCVGSRKILKNMENL